VIIRESLSYFFVSSTIKRENSQQAEDDDIAETVDQTIQTVVMIIV
jgi:hypothetical protein